MREGRFRHNAARGIVSMLGLCLIDRPVVIGPSALGLNVYTVTEVHVLKVTE
jgi:hypothetical protein